MLLEKELYVATDMTEIDKAYKRSLIALGLLLASLALKLPPHFLSLNYILFIRICSFLSFGCILLALYFASLSFVSLIRHRSVRKARFYVTFIIDLLIIVNFLVGLILWA
jgi:hypothetical protein